MASAVSDGKKKIYIGCFDTQEEAHEAYVNAIKEI